MKKNSQSLVFDERAVFEAMEACRRPNGAFIAAPSPDYNAMWIRDTLYTNFSYWYLGQFNKLSEGMWIVFDLFKKYRHKLVARIASPEEIPDGVIHAKYYADTLEEITPSWGHDQLDVVGLFLYITADLDYKNIRVIRNETDLEILQLLVYYLRSKEYWRHADFGIWEECKITHLSSIGSCLSALRYLKKQSGLEVVVPDTLVQQGETALTKIFPAESLSSCSKPHHNHDCDAAELSLIWPYHVLTQEQTREVLNRLTGGHRAENGEHHCLLQKNGLNRYWGDDYYRSTEGKCRGISAEWPMFFFWISIVHSQLHEYDAAAEWFGKGCRTMVNNMIPEAYHNDQPNEHMPLAWAHAISLIAFRKLPDEIRARFSI